MMRRPDKMGKKNKSSKMLGIEVGDLLEACQRKGSMGALSLSEWQMFWQTVRNRRDATTFLDKLLNSLTVMLDNPDAFEVKMATVINTIQFISLFLTPDLADAKLARTMEQWAKRGADYSRQFPQAHEVIRTMQMVQTREKLDEHAALQCLILHLPDEYRRMADNVNFPTFTDQDIRSGESVFYWPYLCRRLGEQPGLASQLLQRLVFSSQTLAQQVKANPKLAQTTLMATLHMVRELLSAEPLADQAAADLALRVLSQFFLWPLPFGLVARDLLGAVTEERASPGANMRRRFRAEQATAQVPDCDDDLGQAARPAYYFVNSGSDWVQTFVQTMALRPYDQVEQTIGMTYQGELSASTALLLAASTLRSCAEGGLAAEDEATLRRLGAEQALDLWRDTGRALDETEEAARAGDAAPRRARLAEVRAGLAGLAAASASPCLPAGAGGTGALPGPRLPPVAHLSFESKVDSYSFVDKASFKLMCLQYVPFPTTPVSQQLEDLLSKYRCSDNSPVNVRLVLAAGNPLMHSFVCAYAGLLQSKPEGVKGVNLQVFLVPLERNHVASFLARFDSWYNRHVYVPFRAPVFMMPWIDKDGKALAEAGPPEADDPTPIGVLYRDLVSVYLREARSTYRMQMWQLDGWLSPRAAGAGAGGDDEHSQLPDQSIPFLQRFEMGLVPDARAFQKDRDLPPDTAFQNLVKDRNFIFNPPEVRISFTRVDMHGHPLPELTDEGVTYNSVLLSNNPRRGDPCFPPSPARPWLEMHARPTDSSRNRTKARKNALVNDPKQHVTKVAIECTDPERAFLVRIDGNNFGPFHRVEVQTLTHQQTGELLHFPIQTFFPIEA